MSPKIDRSIDSARSKRMPIRGMIAALCAAVLGLASVPAASATSEPVSYSAATSPTSHVAADQEAIEPAIAWGAVIRVFTSRPACEAARATYHALFPEYSALECQRSGGAWYLVRA